MSNWKLLNQHRVNCDPSVNPFYWTTPDYGFNGMFRLPHGTGILRCIASDGMGWQHVSVSVERDKRPPRWDTMCWVKELFWDDEDWVVQFHPAKSEYVNYHPGCLHLWRPTEAKLPTPLAMMVGPKGKP